MEERARHHHRRRHSSSDDDETDSDEEALSGEGTRLRPLGGGGTAVQDEEDGRSRRSSSYSRPSGKKSIDLGSRHPAGTQLEQDDDDEVFITDGAVSGPVGRGWRSWGAARKGELALWAFFVLVGALILLAGTFLVLHNATRASRHPDLVYPHARLFVYQTEALTLPVGQHLEFVLANVSRPEPGRALALHQVRLQLVDEAGRAVPLEQVYRSYMVLSASADVHDSNAGSSSRSSAQGEGRVLVALGPEGSKESVRLPQGYYIHSPEGERWSLRCRLYSSWGQVAGANFTVAVLLNITYSPLATAIKEEMQEVRYQALGSSDVTNSSNPNGFLLPQDGTPDATSVQWSYDVEWSPSQAEQVILAFGFTQIGALSSQLLEVSTAGAESQLMELQVTYEKSGLIAAMDRQYPTSLVLHPGAKLRIRSSFANRPFGRVFFYWQLYLHAH